MKSIVAVDSEWGIGKNNDLLFDIKADMRHFVENTRGKTVVMVKRNKKFFVPTGKTVLLADDKLLIITDDQCFVGQS